MTSLGTAVALEAPQAVLQPEASLTEQIFYITQKTSEVGFFAELLQRTFKQTVYFYPWGSCYSLLAQHGSKSKTSCIVVSCPVGFTEGEGLVVFHAIRRVLPQVPCVWLVGDSEIPNFLNRNDLDVLTPTVGGGLKGVLKRIGHHIGKEPNLDFR